MNFRTFIFILYYLIIAHNSLSQSYFHNISGYVFDSENNPLPYVNIYIKNQINKGTTTDENGRFYIELPENNYEVVFSSIGYTEQIIQVNLNKNVKKNIWLQPSEKQLNEIVVKVSKKDPSYEIMKKVIHKKEFYANQYNSLKSDFYIKAYEIGKLDSSRMKPLKMKEQAPIDTIFKANSIKKNIPNMNMLEIKGTLNFQQPNLMKEIVDGYILRGSDYDLYFKSHTEASFNFYYNLIYSKLTESPLMSPLNWSAMLSYKFELVKDYMEDGKLISQIKVIPRKSANNLFEGEIHIVHGFWNIKYLELSIDKKNLNQFNKFTIIQNYEHYEDSIWVLKKQQFNYYSKEGKTDFNGTTSVVYSNTEINPEFPKRFFSNELAVKTEEAYEKDSSYWNLTRPEPLTKEQQKYVAFTDSVKQVKESEKYKDSVQNLHNKITIINLLWDGQPNINWRKERRMYFAPVPAMFEPLSVGGMRVGYWFSYYKRFSKKQHFRIFPHLTYGIRNEDVKGSITASYLYNPIHQRRITLNFGRNFELINPYDAYINMFRRSNFYEHDYISLWHTMELFNGFYLSLNLEYADRRSIQGYKFGELSDKVFENNIPVSFDYYTSLVSTVNIEYTYNQKYIREPYQKIVLGSKWPTIGLTYKSGIQGVVNSSVRFDYLEFEIEHIFPLGLMGESQYRLSTGKFLNKETLKLVDYKFMRQGDKLLYTNPFNTFQLLAFTYPVFDWFYEAHYVHRFNGVLMNKFPLLRKLRLRLVGGAGALYTVENQYKHVELFAGIERVIRIRRERFRLGVYGASSQSNSGTDFGYKFSFEYFDKENQQWGF